MCDCDQKMTSRYIGIAISHGNSVSVEHIYPRTPAQKLLGLGEVGMTVMTGLGADYDDDPDRSLSITLDAPEALLLADRITRAAHIVLEAEEGRPHDVNTGAPLKDDGTLLEPDEWPPF